MNDTIQVIDKETGTKQTYILQEKPEQQEIDLTVLIIVFKGIIKVLKFSLYVCLSFLELFIRVVKVLFNLTEYKPLQSLTNRKNSFLTRVAQKEINKEKVRFASDYLGRHEFVFPRSDDFLNLYKEIQQRLFDISEHNINLNKELYRDTVNQISCLVVEAEKQALKLGYEYGRETKFKLDTSTVYEEFIADKVMTGESNRKFRTNSED